MRVIVDFHSAEGDTLWALKSHARDQVIFDDFGPGALVLLDDTEGRTADGVIRTVAEDGLIEIDVIWETWQDSAVYRAAPKVFHEYSLGSLNQQTATTAPELQLQAG